MGLLVIHAGKVPVGRGGSTCNRALLAAFRHQRVPLVAAYALGIACSNPSDEPRLKACPNWLEPTQPAAQRVSG